MLRQSTFTWREACEVFLAGTLGAVLGVAVGLHFDMSLWQSSVICAVISGALFRPIEIAATIVMCAKAMPANTALCWHTIETELAAPHNQRTRWWSRNLDGIFYALGLLTRLAVVIAPCLAVAFALERYLSRHIVESWFEASVATFVLAVLLSVVLAFFVAVTHWVNPTTLPRKGIFLINRTFFAGFLKLVYWIVKWLGDPVTFIFSSYKDCIEKNMVTGLWSYIARTPVFALISVAYVPVAIGLIVLMGLGLAVDLTLSALFVLASTARLSAMIGAATGALIAQLNGYGCILAAAGFLGGCCGLAVYAMAHLAERLPTFSLPRLTIRV